MNGHIMKNKKIAIFSNPVFFYVQAGEAMYDYSTITLMDYQPGETPFCHPPNVPSPTQYCGRNKGKKRTRGEKTNKGGKNNTF